MTAPNHIIGGIAITGISLSFWNINIFSSPIYLGLSVFASLLPDIDHTKSIIGKMFWPLSKWIDKKYGHRTITHSLTFLIPVFMASLFLELNIINPYYNLEGSTYSYIMLFGIFSHFILDMLTVQGIPLFYPFNRNPCVVPANPSYRMKSGNLKSETIALMFFSVIVLSSYDLFKNGFWTSYNRSFGTLTHVEREFKNSPNFVNVEYSYLFNGALILGNGIIVDATAYESVIFTNQNKILILTAADNRIRDIEILPSKNEMIYKIKEVDYYNISHEELTKLISNKIVSGSIQSTHDFYLNSKLINKKTEIKNQFNPKFTPFIEDSLHSKNRQLLKLKKAKAFEIWKQNQQQYLELENLKSTLKNLENKLIFESDLYKINSLEKSIIIQKSLVSKFKIKPISNPVLIEEIKQIENQLTQKEEVKYTVKLKILEVPPLPSVASVTLQRQ